MRLKCAVNFHCKIIMICWRNSGQHIVSRRGGERAPYNNEHYFLIYLICARLVDFIITQKQRVEIKQSLYERISTINSLLTYSAEAL